ncbi:hypothetical protein Tco_1221227 [Tanacetum coccineum]
MEELTAAVMLMARIQPANGNAETVPSYDAKVVIEVNALSKWEIIVAHLTMIQMLMMNIMKFESGLGYKNPECLKKAIVTQLKMYVGERLHSANLTIDSPDSEETLEVYKTDVILMSASLSKNLKELKEELIEEVQELLNIFESMEQKVNGKSSKENVLQNEIDRLMEVSLTSEIRNCVLISVEKKNELLKAKLEKSLSDSNDIQANLLKKIKILKNDFE